jgi:hypothetical protein
VVTAQIADGILYLRVRGLHKVWAMTDSLEIPLASIETVEAAGAIARSGPEGTRNPGTSIPFLLNAGSFNSGVKRSFWDVHNPDNAIRIKLKSSRGLFSAVEDRYDEVIVEVLAPAETVAEINQALEAPGP